MKLTVNATEFDRWTLMERRWKIKQRVRASPDACSNVQPPSEIKLAPNCLMVPNVSKATGCKLMFAHNVEYLHLLSAAISVTLDREN